MKEINIAKILVIKRKEKGVTQDELASYIGVSKASVSKWETAQCYPDITILPQLATYFNISIDELIDYAPQMTKEDIKKLYLRLSASFSTQPFDDVMLEFNTIVKKYYSCFPLLVEMSVLLMNHYMLAKEKEGQDQVINDIMILCSRVITESNDTNLLLMATSLKATCYIMLQQPLEVLALLGETVDFKPDNIPLMANAHIMLNNYPKANEVLQASNYEHIQGILGNTIILMTTWGTDYDKFEMLVRRMMVFIENFKLNKLTTNLALIFYLQSAQGYTRFGNPDKALDYLQMYAELCPEFPFSFILHGDEFFDSIDGWFSGLNLGINSLRSENLIKISMLEAVADNPLFTTLQDNSRFKHIIKNLKLKLGGL